MGQPPVAHLVAQADSVDGFVTSCTGNLDGTGQCVNQETGQRFVCVIIPGQVIDCKSPKAKQFQCVWISGTQANYAEFWCDAQVDALLRNEISSLRLQPSLNSPLGPGPSSGSFSSNEINPDRYNRDRFKTDDLKLGDPFGKLITKPAVDPSSGSNSSSVVDSLSTNPNPDAPSPAAASPLSNPLIPSLSTFQSP
jgi:hypothetical protein